MKTSFNFWRLFLLWANIFILIIGLLIAFAGNSKLFIFHNQATAEVFFNNELTKDIIDFKAWLFGIIGGTIIGFHILAIFIIQFSFAKKEKWAWYALMSGITAWFLIDSSVSVYYGAIHNVIQINIFAYLLFAIPLLITRNEFNIQNKK